MHRFEYPAIQAPCTWSGASADGLWADIVITVRSSIRNMVDPFYRCINARRLKLVGAEKTAWLVQGIDLSVRRHWSSACGRAPVWTGYESISSPRFGFSIVSYMVDCFWGIFVRRLKLIWVKKTSWFAQDVHLSVPFYQVQA